MQDFKNIEEQLVCILDTGYLLLDHLEKKELDFERVQSLLSKRGEQIQSLNQLKKQENTFGEEQKKELRYLFTRLVLLEKEMNNILAKLSLTSKASLKEIVLHKKAKKSYTVPTATSKFLNAQVSG